MLSWLFGGSILFAIASRGQTVEFIIEIAKAFHIGTSFLAVMGFYFGVQLFRNK